MAANQAIVPAIGINAANAYPSLAELTATRKRLSKFQTETLPSSRIAPSSVVIVVVADLAIPARSFVSRILQACRDRYLSGNQVISQALLQ